MQFKPALFKGQLAVGKPRGDLSCLRIFKSSGSQRPNPLIVQSSVSSELSLVFYSVTGTGWIIGSNLKAACILMESLSVHRRKNCFVLEMPRT